MSLQQARRKNYFIKMQSIHKIGACNRRTQSKLAPNCQAAKHSFAKGTRSMSTSAMKRYKGSKEVCSHYHSAVSYNNCPDCNALACTSKTKIATEKNNKKANPKLQNEIQHTKWKLSFAFIDVEWKENAFTK